MIKKCIDITKSALTKNAPPTFARFIYDDSSDLIYFSSFITDHGNSCEASIWGVSDDPSRGKTYVVFRGKNPGIYSTWEETDFQVTGFKRAVHKSYLTREEAVKAYTKYMEKRNSIHARSVPKDEASSSTATFSSRNPIEALNLSELIEAQLQLANEQHQLSLRVAEVHEAIEKKLRSLSLSDDAK